MIFTKYLQLKKKKKLRNSYENNFFVNILSIMVIVKVFVFQLKFLSIILEYLMTKMRTHF